MSRRSNHCAGALSFDDVHAAKNLPHHQAAQENRAGRADCVQTGASAGNKAVTSTDSASGEPQSGESASEEDETSGDGKRGAVIAPSDRAQQDQAGRAIVNGSTIPVPSPKGSLLEQDVLLPNVPDEEKLSSEKVYSAEAEDVKGYMPGDTETDGKGSVFSDEQTRSAEYITNI